MARVTVEDCIVRVPNRFELVLHAAQRARNIGRGEELPVERDNDKNPVVALREIAEATLDLPALEADLVKSLQRAPEPEPAEEEVLDLIATDENIFGVMDVNEEQPGDGQGLQALPAEDIEAAIAAELAGGKRGRRPQLGCPRSAPVHRRGGHDAARGHAVGRARAGRPGLRRRRPDRPRAGG